MPNRREPSNTTFYFRIPIEVADRFDDHIEKNALNRNQIATLIIERYLNRQVKTDSDKPKATS